MTDPEPAFAGPYMLTKTLGQGMYGTVKLGMHGRTGEKVAVKCIAKGDLTKRKSSLDRVEREIAILRLMNHPCVTKMYDVIQTKTHLLIVLEYMPGGDLYQYLVKNAMNGLPVHVAFRFFYQLLSGTKYCHSCSICHRDIKPENILLDETQENIKLTDFGMSNLIKDDQLLETSCGSPHYAAPEIIQGRKYDGTKSDVWSLGVMLFGLFAGRLPFDDREIPKLLDKVCRNQYTMPGHFDGKLRDLVRRMLTTDPDARYTLNQVMEHPFWVSQCADLHLDPQGLKPPHEMSPTGEVVDPDAPMPEEYDTEVLDFITVQHHWMDVDSLKACLSSPEPNLEKAFYKLLIQQKKSRGSLQHMKSMVVKKLMEDIVAGDQSLKALLRNNRGRSEGSLMQLVEQEAAEEKKKKGVRGALHKLFHRKSSSKDVTAPEDNTKDKSSSKSSEVEVTFLKSMGRQKSAPIIN
eukprot:NODE_867_length_2289_cov_45.612188_g741_i0.p1 GENE.NODE_867_length_2289_cov_45.612188_g741_i0~~NODE_867_length_2289_cov_45.612188_g741_i0.p1  ORF type:complete len:462 (-),score=68.90 NODE_867_length_2289_cov_45.612188_g741_i0:851-2236(-)